MAGELLPSGREQAIETLIDIEPEGGSFRAARVLEEAIPQALLHRPNAVSKAALVEQAYSLQEYEVDQLAKYDAVFGNTADDESNKLPTRSGNLFHEEEACVVAPTKDVAERILKHHAKVLAAKRGQKKSVGSTPPPALVAALRSVFAGSTDSPPVLRSLLEYVMEHPVFKADRKEPESGDTTVENSGDTSEDTPTAPVGSCLLEEVLCSLCTSVHSAPRGYEGGGGTRSEVLHGLLIGILTILTGYEVRDTTKTTLKEHSDLAVVPPLQAGALMFLLQPPATDQKSPWNLDGPMLAYLGELAATYEERIEIQKSRLLARLEKSNVVEAKPEADSDPTQLSASIDPNDTSPSLIPLLATPTGDTLDTSQPLSTPDAVAVPEDDDDDGDDDNDSNNSNRDVLASALSAAVFESIISAANGEEISSQAGGSSEDDESDDSSDEDDHDSDCDDPNQSGDSSSSSSSSGSEPDLVQRNINLDDSGSDDDDDDDEGDAEMVLRQALALSLEQVTPLEDNGDTGNDVMIAERLTSSGHSTPITETPTSARIEGALMESDDYPLPSLPSPPKEFTYPYCNDATPADGDHVNSETACFDPAALNRFGVLPAPHVLVHLLQFLTSQMHAKIVSADRPTSFRHSDMQSCSTTVGGVGCSLFPPSQQLLKPQKKTPQDDKSTVVSLQLFVSLLLLMKDRRDNAIAQLALVWDEEQKAASDNKNNTDDNPTSEEGDDPAIALALHYLDETVGESKESLEGKGMRRKAAAAAHDTAVFLESLRKETDLWRQRVKLFSFCTLLVMNSLELFLQSVVRGWLPGRDGLSVSECATFIPEAVILKMTGALTGLCPSASEQQRFLNLVEDGEIEETFMVRRLYNKSMLLWSEAVPILYPGAGKRLTLLESLLEACQETEGYMSAPFLGSMTLPNSPIELLFGKLGFLCRRFRVSDLLDDFVASPMCYTNENENTTDDLDGPTLSSPRLPRSVMALIRATLTKKSFASSELKNFYLALCHRCHVRILLWDGLYACLEQEPAQTQVSMASVGSESVKVNASPSNNLLFDATKCSDSMALIPNPGESTSSVNGSAVHQRASKVWGTVLSSTSFTPKTGVKRWAVRLDKCEKGHVFVGVATSQASMRTYVGGDKYGWGMIGTQALWHDRRKIRGDYGATFRTGSTIIVTLDTDAGTLSFGSWKEGSSPPATASDTMVHNLTSPRRHTQSGGVVEEWGVAFEGLPLDSRLYPAVGLYQRDDRVTLIPVESGVLSNLSGEDIDLSGALCYYPQSNPLTETRAQKLQISRVRSYNNVLSWDGILYSVDTLRFVVECISDLTEEHLAQKLLPSLAASLCLIPPSIPVLSERFGLALLPEIAKCIQAIGGSNSNDSLGKQLCTGLREGKWVMRATGATGSGSPEEYVVDISCDAATVEGTGIGTTGKSKNSVVKICGAVAGSSLHFVEEWTDSREDDFHGSSSAMAASSCIVAARLSVDGRKFEGTYRNVQFGTAGQIAGLWCKGKREMSKFGLKKAPTATGGEAVDTKSACIGRSLLCLSHSHLVALVAEDAAADHANEFDMLDPELGNRETLLSHRRLIEENLALPLLSRVTISCRQADILRYCSCLRDVYAPPEADHHAEDLLSLISDAGVLKTLNWQNTELQGIPDVELLRAQVALSDERIRRLAGGKGSLSALCSTQYQATRLSIVSALLHHSGLAKEFLQNPEEPTAAVKDSWRCALQVMEDGLRKATSSRSEPSVPLAQQAAATCSLFANISGFLLSVNFPSDEPLEFTVVASNLKHIYRVITSTDEILALKTTIQRTCIRGILRMVPVEAVGNMLSAIDFGCASDDFLTVESLLTTTPRLLGTAFSTHRSRRDLGGDYLSGLVGLSQEVRDALENGARKIWRSLALIVIRSMETKPDCQAVAPFANESLVVAVLVCFVSATRKCDLDFVIHDSGILIVLPKILASRREAIVVFPDDVKDLAGILQREMSRSVLSIANAFIHVLTYQSLRPALSSGLQKVRPSLANCLEMLLSEFTTLLPLLESSVAASLSDERRKESLEDWKTWSGMTLKEKDGMMAKQTKRSKERVGKTGIEYLIQHGINDIRSPPHSPPKSTRGGKQPQAQSPKPGKYQGGRLCGSFCHFYLSHVLHLLSSVSKSRSVTAALSIDPKWMDTLFRFVGIKLSYDEAKTVTHGTLCSPVTLLPGRYRARVLRVLSYFMEEMPPNENIVMILFALTGASSMAVSQSIEDERSVSRECVSLLRRLHSTGARSWKVTVNSAVERIRNAVEDSQGGLARKAGILAFLNGDLGIVGLGSFVLLKPTAAAPLATEHQVNSPGKAHPSGSGSSSFATGVTPHHLIGNGTEGIVAGMCRSEASAGIISSVDLKSGVCEVVLLERKGGEPEVGDSLSSTGLVHSATGGRGSLTVRALRSPLGDIVLAQEVPLELDDDIAVERLTLDLLRRAMGEIENVRNDSDVDEEKKCFDDAMLQSYNERSNQLLFAAMTMRASLSVLSDFRTLDRVMKQPDASDIWPALLKMLSIDASKQHDLLRASHNLPLSSLPVHEARSSHLLLMMRCLVSKSSCLQDIDETMWKERIIEYEDRKKEAETPKKESVTRGGYKTPPSNESEAPERLPVIPGSSTSRLSRSRGSDTGSNRAISQSTAGSENSAEDDDANHLREVAIAQMAELGLPRSWCELALRRTGGTNIEAAVHFCLERGGEMERLLADESERERVLRRQSSGGSTRARTGRDGGPSSHLLRQLQEMGFPSRWCAEALAATGNNVDEALTWILTNGERLSAEDEGMEDEDDGDIDDGSDGEDSLGDDCAGVAGASDDKDSEVIDDGDGDVQDQKPKAQWSGSVMPLRFISGRSSIDPETLAISGLPTGGFSSVGTKGVLLTSGKWYYEAILETAGCLQIGWADGSFAGHCHADRGDGCGDGPSSWAYDGWRRYRWHATATEWGCRWREGDVIGCLVDMDDHIVSFTLNGRAEEIGMGVAFSGHGFRPCGGVYACVSFNRREKLRLILGGDGNEEFVHKPPSGYRGVGQAVLNAVAERTSLVALERVLDQTGDPGPVEDEQKKFLCDFSDGEHGHELMAWAHRYYGADASVHLGSTRNHQSSPLTKQSLSSGSHETTSLVCLERRVEAAWSSSKSPIEAIEQNIVVQYMSQGFGDVGRAICRQFTEECLIVSSLWARKLFLHIMISSGNCFDPSLFISRDHEEVGCSHFWKAFESCVSLQSVGWVGEAGAMAVAAEALGLGISSNERGSLKPTSQKPGVANISDLDDGMVLPAGGMSQVLSAINDTGRGVSTASTFVASAEATIGSGGGGGLLVFLSKSIQSAVSSAKFRQIVLAAISRSVRLLSVVEFDGEDSLAEDSSDEDDEIEKASTGKPVPIRKEADQKFVPDARLISFLTGLLLSQEASSSTEESHKLIQAQLFQAWSVGLLSASLPWRMVCAFTAAGILNMYPQALGSIMKYPTLAMYYGRLKGTVARRMWAERAAVPVCSRYSQALVDLMCSVDFALQTTEASPEFLQYWQTVTVDAATPRPQKTLCEDWEVGGGWISSDRAWEVWTGTVEYHAVDWKTPLRSAVRTLMDGGDGPPMLREGCVVMRGRDWSEGTTNGNEDGKDLYESEKLKRETEKRNADEADPVPELDEAIDPADPSPAEDSVEIDAEPKEKESTVANTPTKKKKKASPKLPIGTVLSIEPWNGIPAMARRVRWNLTGEEGIYRYGGDGGRYDIIHVEMKRKSTKEKKRHPLPESAEQCAARHGFGGSKKFNILLRLHRVRNDPKSKEESTREGIMEWPDFGAGIAVESTLHADGSVTILEKELLYGAKDSGWESRFGHPCYTSGTTVLLTQTASSEQRNQADVDVRSPYQSLYEELLGSTTMEVPHLRDRESGCKLRLTSEFRLVRGRGYTEMSLRDEFSLLGTPPPSPIQFDREYHASSLSLSKDGRTVSCVSSEGRGTAFASMGFTKGVHYWEVKLEQADIGSVFIGVAEKPTGNGSGATFGFETQPRLNRWHGWGFVNFRATYTAGAERIYGAHCHAGDTVGVLLDCDAGRVSFFFDGLKYGEHILNDLGCAFENISPFGFNVDGCGNGGAGQGAPSGIEGGRSGRYLAQGSVRPRALWPVIGLRNHGDRVTLSPKWSSSHGVDGVSSATNVMAVNEVLNSYFHKKMSSEEGPPQREIPSWFVSESFKEYEHWKSNRWNRWSTRANGPFPQSTFGLEIEFDASNIACASACALLGLHRVLLPGDRVRLTRSAGRILELAEEAVVLGTHQGRLYYKIVSQKSEGGSLTEGGGRAWCWDESEVVDGVSILNEPKGLDIDMPLMDRFKCTASGGMRIVFEGGAVIRSDLEIFDGSTNLGNVPFDTVLPPCDVLERRVNSCGVVRYRVKFESLEGWISSRIRGGNEEAIVEPVSAATDEGLPSKSFASSLACASHWEQEYNEMTKRTTEDVEDRIAGIVDADSFLSVARRGIFQDLTEAESDAFLVQLVCSISDHSEGGNALDVPFHDLASSLDFALAVARGESTSSTRSSPAANQLAASKLNAMGSELPSLPSLMARIAMLRAFNRRAKVALPWMSLRPSQEGSAILGGVCGHGASVERAGRYANRKALSRWVQAPCVATKMRSLRGLFFTSVKKGILTSITEATTTPTPLSHDEYELPREIRTVRLNRLKARRVMASLDTSAKRKHSVFAQLQSETKGWGGAALRRGYVAKGHGGQKRAFKVKLIGEGVNDYSGPYREAFTDALKETVDADVNGKGSLAVFDPTPNTFNGIGDIQGLFMFSLNGRSLETSFPTSENISSDELEVRDSFASLTMTRDEASREVEDSLVFLGRLVGAAFRHSILLDLPLSLENVWKPIVEEESNYLMQLRELDVLESKRLGSDSDRIHSIILWQRKMLNSFMEGLATVLPIEILSIFTGSEIRNMMCGSPEVDVDLLLQVVEYEGYEATDQVIEFFWETLREFSNEERELFLQFVWARNRLPMKESDFESPFKIQKDNGDNKDEALPSASTCFFTLTLPEYKSKEQLRDKLLFAIKNVTTMETDFQTNTAEIAEGYRAF